MQTPKQERTAWVLALGVNMMNVKTHVNYWISMQFYFEGCKKACDVPPNSITG